jgi:Ca2+-binding RTX toxin-like protein
VLEAQPFDDGAGIDIDDSIFTGSGNDTLWGNEGNDTMAGGGRRRPSCAPAHEGDGDDGTNPA